MKYSRINSSDRDPGIKFSFVCVVLSPWSLESTSCFFRLLGQTPSLKLCVRMITSFQKCLSLCQRAVMSRGEQRICCAFNGFLVEVQSFVKQENKTWGMLLFVGLVRHAKY